MSRKESVIKKGQYYVLYLGWKEVQGLYGREFTEPIVRELLARRNAQHNLPKLTIVVDKKNVKITQDVEKKKGKIEKVKYPPIPAHDVTYSCHALSPDRDVVACIFLGFNPYTNSAAHVHVYRCDSEETASIMVQHLNQLIELPDHQKRLRKIERDLVQKGQVVARLSMPADGHSSNASTRSDPGDFTDPDAYRVLKPADDIANDITMYDSLAAELHQKLSAGPEAPILLPPKDYDTICRRHGNLEDVENRKSLQTNIVGVNVNVSPQKSHVGTDSHADSGNGSGESDIPSPISEYSGQLSPRQPYEGALSGGIMPPYQQYVPPEDAPHSLSRIFQPPQDYSPISKPQLSRRDSAQTQSSHYSNESRGSGNSAPKYDGHPRQGLSRHNSREGDYRGQLNRISVDPKDFDNQTATSSVNNLPQQSNFDSNFSFGNPDSKLTRGNHTRTFSDEGYNTVSDTIGPDMHRYPYAHDSASGWKNMESDSRQYHQQDPLARSQPLPRTNYANPQQPYAQDDYYRESFLQPSMPEVEMRRFKAPAGAVSVLPRTRPTTADGRHSSADVHY